MIQGQIKLKETALESSSNMFIEKEKNLKNRIEELETKLDQNSQEVVNIFMKRYKVATQKKHFENMKI